MVMQTDELTTTWRLLKRVEEGTASGEERAFFFDQVRKCLYQSRRKKESVRFYYENGRSMTAVHNFLKTFPSIEELK